MYVESRALEKPKHWQTHRAALAAMGTQTLGPTEERLVWLTCKMLTLKVREHPL